MPGSPSVSIQNQRLSHPAHGFPNASQHITGFHPLLWKLRCSLAETGTIIACLDDKQNQIMAVLVFDYASKFSSHKGRKPFSIRLGSNIFSVMDAVFHTSVICYSRLAQLHNYVICMCYILLALVSDCINS